MRLVNAIAMEQPGCQVLVDHVNALQLFHSTRHVNHPGEHLAPQALLLSHLVRLFSPLLQQNLKTAVFHELLVLLDDEDATDFIVDECEVLDQVWVVHHFQCFTLSR